MNSVISFFITTMLTIYSFQTLAIDFDRVIEKGKDAKNNAIQAKSDSSVAANQAENSITQFRNDDEIRNTVQTHPWKTLEIDEVSSGFYRRTIDCGFTYTVVVSINQNDQGAYFYNGNMYRNLSDAVRIACSQ